MLPENPVPKMNNLKLIFHLFLWDHQDPSFHSHRVYDLSSPRHLRLGTLGHTEFWPQHHPSLWVVTMHPLSPLKLKVCQKQNPLTTITLQNLFFDFFGLSETRLPPWLPSPLAITNPCGSLSTILFYFSCYLYTSSPGEEWMFFLLGIITSRYFLWCTLFKKIKRFGE